MSLERAEPAEPEHGYFPRHALNHIPIPGRPLPHVSKRVMVAAAAACAIALLASGSAAAANDSSGHRTSGPLAGARPAQPNLLALAGLGGGSASSVTGAAATGALPAAAPPVAVPKAAGLAGIAADGIPNVALNAYRLAAARMAVADPGCGISWPLLAGIGRIESDHGRFGGATLNADGTSTPKIIGPALDGDGYPLIRSTDGGVLDGDRVYAHAVGPMQFLPSTWAEYASDGNGDGVADPFNINDAALAAARYLCAAGGNLRSSADEQDAVYAYNHDPAYVSAVLTLAHDYAHGIRVTGIPIVGPTTGSLPAIRTATGSTSGGSTSGGSSGSGAVLAGGGTSVAPTAPTPSATHPTPAASAQPTSAAPSPTTAPTTSARPNPVASVVCFFGQLINLCPKS